MKETVTIKTTKQGREHLRIAAALADKAQPEVSEAAFKRERERLEKEKRDGK